jgi:hypothetical protein
MNWFRQIDDYLNHGLSTEEREAFEDALKKNAALRRQLKKTQIYQRDRDDYVKDIFRRLVEEDRQKKLKKCKRKILLVGATLLILIVLFIIWIFSSSY